MRSHAAKVPSPMTFPTPTVRSLAFAEVAPDSRVTAAGDHAALPRERGMITVIDSVSGAAMAGVAA